MPADKDFGPHRERLEPDHLIHDDRASPPQTILGLGVDEALRAGDLLAYLSTIGQPIDVEDVLIGATTLVRRLTVVTTNVRHFRRIPSLSVEDWTV